MIQSPRQIRRTQFHEPKNQTSKILITLCSGLVFLFFVFYFWISSTGDVLVDKKIVRINRGDTYNTLPQTLEMDISPLRYKLYIKYFGQDFPELKVGQYTLPSETNLETFFTKILSSPTHTDQTITILPGWNLYDIDAYFSSKGILPTGKLLDTVTENFGDYQKDFSFLQGTSSIEGFFYPDTYRIRQDADADSIVRVLLKEFEKKIGESYRSLGKDAYNTLILASIVEREERDHEMQSVVAGILKKRYETGMAIGADATVCTGYGKTQKQCTPEFIASVIRDSHPYNTRNRRGYTPTPISNMSLDTWKQTIGAQESEYFYYLHDSTGRIHFARTLEEHNINKQKYLQ